MTSQTHDRKRRRKGLVAWGALAGVAALITTAAFTDVARLNIGGENGIGGADSTYNIQVGATDAAGNFVAGWQEADEPAGVPIRLEGAQSLFPGSDAISVDIPVRNDSVHFDSSLAVTLVQLADDVDNERITDSNYLDSLRFDVAMPATALAPATTHTDLTFAEVQAIEMGDLEANEESVLTLTVRLLSQSESGATWTDNSLGGKGAFIQAVLDGSSI